MLTTKETELQISYNKNFYENPYYHQLELEIIFLVILHTSSTPIYVNDFVILIIQYTQLVKLKLSVTKARSKSCFFFINDLIKTKTKIKDLRLKSFSLTKKKKSD